MMILIIESKEEVRDLGTMSNTATFSIHIRNIVLKAYRRGGTGVESVPVVEEEFSHDDNLEGPCHSLNRVRLPALKFMEGKGYKSYRSYSTNAALKRLERLHKLSK